MMRHTFKIKYGKFDYENGDGDTVVMDLPDNAVIHKVTDDGQNVWVTYSTSKGLVRKPRSPRKASQ